MRCMTEMHDACVYTHASSSFLHAPSSSSSPLLLPPALVGPLLCSVLVVPEVKSLFQLFLCVYFSPSLPESVNGKFIKLFQQFLLSARGLVWNTPVFWKVLFIIVVRAGYSVGGLGILMYLRLCFSFLSFFFNKPHMLLLNLYFADNVNCLYVVCMHCVSWEKQDGWIFRGRCPR